MIDLFLYVDIPMPVVFLEAIFDWFNETYTDIIKWFGGLTLGFGAWFDSFWADVTYVWDSAQRGLGYVITTLQGWWAFVIDLWLDISVIFWDGVFIAIRWIGDFFLPLYDLLIDIWNGIAGIGSRGMIELWKVLQPTVTDILDFFLENWEYFLLFLGGGLVFLVARGALVAYSFIAAFLRSPFFLRFAARFLGKFGKLGALIATWLAASAATSTAAVSAITISRAVIWLLLIGAFSAFTLFMLRSVLDIFIFPSLGNIAGGFFNAVVHFSLDNTEGGTAVGLSAVNTHSALWVAWGSHIFSAIIYITALDFLASLYLNVWIAIFVMRRVRFVIALS